MKISVITRHAVTNYGSLLQAYATQEALERLGQTVEIVDYVRRDEEPINFERTMLASKPNWNKNPFRRLTYTALRTPGSVISGSLFERERAKLLKRTRRYISEDDLRNDPPFSRCIYGRQRSSLGNGGHLSLRFLLYALVCPQGFT